MERDIDRHEPRTSKNTLSRSRINLWRQAWNRCYKIIEHVNSVDFKALPFVFQTWVSILNKTFNSPIRDLEKYTMSMYCYNQEGGPREVLQFYVDESMSIDGTRAIYVIFNACEFKKHLDRYCNDFSSNNRMLVDESRGTINISRGISDGRPPAKFYQTLTTWQLFFIFTCHAMAHLELFYLYDHAFFDTHMNIRESVFYKIHFYGQMVWNGC
ncbi:hypothetical protein RF55_17327 [Lasius niger]|uniref:Uncharacterized protein n=1 Tax=Lasius niger TaxID=67767 RepID=A0A0J7K2M1_LASNI|nr:hypothetical protein RF55_17327 [Lasius niger]